MRFVLSALLLLSTSACGEPQVPAPQPTDDAPPTAQPVAPSEPAEIGVTASALDCPMEQAVYSEPQKGFELRFRRGESWEMPGMTDSIFDLVFPDGRIAWGYISSNMGTSRNTGHIFHGCKRPGPDDGNMSEQAIAECQVWEGLAYSLNRGEPGYMPSEGSNAPERVLMTDLGRKIRYSLVDGPGDEPWDVFTFKSCQPPTPKRLPADQ